MATRRWRPLALASVVTATLAGIVVLQAVFADGGDEPGPASSPEEATPPPTLVPSSPTPLAEPAISAVEPVLKKAVFRAGEQITVSRGVGFLSAETGALESWSPLTASGAPYDSIATTPDGALLVAWATEPGEPPWIVERATGRTWRLRADLQPLVEAGHGLLLPVALRDGDQIRLALLNLGDASLRPFGNNVHYLAGFFGIVSPDGRRVAMHSGEEVFLLELATLKTTAVARDINPDEESIQALAGGLGFVIAPHDGALPRRWFSWEGAQVERQLQSGAISPNGKYIATAWSPAPIKAFGVGGYPTVGAVTISERQTGRPVARFLGSEASPWSEFAWSASGERLVLQVPAGYVLVGIDAQVVAEIPDDIHVLNPRPSPTIAGLLGTDRGTIINTVRNTTVAPLYAELVWRARWSSRPGELIVELSSPGRGRSWPVDVLPFEARKTSESSDPRIRVAAGGDCLNLREQPSADAPALECMPDRLSGVIAPVADPSPDPKGEPPRSYAGVEGPDLTVWLHVSMADGMSGWANAAFLDWAD